MNTSENHLRISREWKRRQTANSNSAYVIKHRSEEKSRHQSARLAVIERLGGKCKVCGWNDWRALQLDHIHGNGAAERRTHPGGNYTVASYKKMLIQPDLEEFFQVLCANHNWIKRYENNEHYKTD